MKRPEWTRNLSPLTWALLWVPMVILLVIGVSLLTVGIFLGCFTVFGMWVTIERVPGVRAFGRTKVGIVVMSLLAAVLVHAVIGTTTATGMIAAATALVVKYFMLQAEAAHYMVHEPTGTKMIETTLA